MGLPWYVTIASSLSQVGFQLMMMMIRALLSNDGRAAASIQRVSDGPEPPSEPEGKVPPVQLVTAAGVLTRARNRTPGFGMGSASSMTVTDLWSTPKRRSPRS